MPVSHTIAAERGGILKSIFVFPFVCTTVHYYALNVRRGSARVLATLLLGAFRVAGGRCRLLALSPLLEPWGAATRFEVVFCGTR
jgi:hypothetical protein